MADRLVKRSILGTSATTNSLLDSEEEFQEEDIWGVTDSSDDHPVDGAGETDTKSSEDLPEKFSLQPAGIQPNYFGEKVFGKGLVSGGDFKSVGLAQGIFGRGELNSVALSQVRGATPSRMIPKMTSSKDNHMLRRQSAPVNIPDWSKSSGHRTPVRKPIAGEEEEEEKDDGPMIPPHEIIAREYSHSVTFSVYSGAGRTLRGRDLSSVRTAVLRQTGFLDS